MTSHADAKDYGFQHTTNEDEDAVFTVIGITAIMQPVEIKEWKQTYEDDPKLYLAIQQLQQGMAYGQFSLPLKGCWEPKKMINRS